jgi:hypothetical protein
MTQSLLGRPPGIGQQQDESFCLYLENAICWLSPLHEKKKTQYGAVLTFMRVWGNIHEEMHWI